MTRTKTSAKRRAPRKEEPLADITFRRPPMAWFNERIWGLDDPTAPEEA